MPPEGLVHVVDDEPGIRWSLGRLFRAAGLSSTGYQSGPDFLRVSATIITGCVLIDVRMPEMDGLELLVRLRAEQFSPPIIMITGHGDIPTAVSAIKSGARDFVEKQSDSELLLEIVRQAMQARDEPERSWESRTAALRVAALSPRERQVLHGIASGNSSKAIAFELGLSVRTVEVYRARMMERLGLRHMAEAVRLAVLARFGSWPCQDPRSPRT